MNYENVYKSICDRGMSRSKRNDNYLERHHILPTFFYKDNKRNHRYKDGIVEGTGENIDNITFLTPREHFIAHLLLCKIWENTKWEYRCYLSVKMFLNGGQVNKNRSIFYHSSRKYEYYRIQANDKISNGKKCTMPAKDAKSGERLGIVSIFHPKVLSGDWVHITKGIKKSEESKKSRSLISRGTDNSNSKYSDNELFESYKICCYHYGKVVNTNLWVLYSQKESLPYLKFTKKFRFGGRGYAGMVQDLIAEIEKDNIEIEIITNYKSYEWRKFVEKEKSKWE